MFGNSHFVVSKKTVLYIHGYADESKFESVSAIVEAYLQRDDHNVLVLDWSELASGNYLIDAVPNAKQVFEFCMNISIKLRFSSLHLEDSFVSIVTSLSVTYIQ